MHLSLTHLDRLERLQTQSVYLRAASPGKRGQRAVHLHLHRVVAVAGGDLKGEGLLRRLARRQGVALLLRLGVGVVGVEVVVAVVMVVVVVVVLEV